jgi:hypothetical protein
VVDFAIRFPVLIDRRIVASGLLREHYGIVPFDGATYRAPMVSSDGDRVANSDAIFSREALGVAAGGLEFDADVRCVGGRYDAIEPTDVPRYYFAAPDALEALALLSRDVDDIMSGNRPISTEVRSGTGKAPGKPARGSHTASRTAKAAAARRGAKAAATTTTHSGAVAPPPRSTAV